MKSFKSFVRAVFESHDDDIEEAHARLDEHHSKNFTQSQKSDDWHQMRNMVPHPTHSPVVDFRVFDRKGMTSLEDVPMHKLVSNQPEVSHEVVSGKLRGTITSHEPETPQVIHHKGTYHLVDGNHRANVALLKGDLTMRAHVYHAPDDTEMRENRPRIKPHPDAKSSIDTNSNR